MEFVGECKPNNILWQNMFNKNFLLVTAQDCSSCYRNFYLTNFLPVNFLFVIQLFLNFIPDTWILPVTGTFFLRQELSSCDRKLLPMMANLFLWLRISSEIKIWKKYQKDIRSLSNSNFYYSWTFISKRRQTWSTIELEEILNFTCTS